MAFNGYIITRDMFTHIVEYFVKYDLTLVDGLRQRIVDAAGELWEVPQGYDGFKYPSCKGSGKDPGTLVFAAMYRKAIGESTPERATEAALKPRKGSSKGKAPAKPAGKGNVPECVASGHCTQAQYDNLAKARAARKSSPAKSIGTAGTVTLTGEQAAALSAFMASLKK